ncbi:MAG: sulfatase [Verrucomicrobiia bacterium]|jgi:N-sulfoglucosamine sulfohydrolase
MNSKLITLVTVASLGFAAAVCFAAGAPPVRNPNILFILTEDQGAHLGVLGTPGLRTPHMDALARSGVLFRNAFVAYPVCSASKACIYTALHNHRNGILNNTVNYHKPAAELTPAQRRFPLYMRNRIAADIPTLTELLRRNGYYQGATHKLHVAPVEKFPYDEFLPNPTGPVMKGFLERATATGRPWFLLYNIPDTHRPYPNSDKVKIRVQPGEVKLPAFLPDTPVVRKDWAEYLAGIERADTLVGQAMEVLRESGQQDRTIVVFMGDHGPTFQHGKMTPYDLGLRVPLAFAGPGIRAGTTHVLASELDLMPTLLDLAGAAVPPGLHGISLRGVLEGRRGAKKRDFVFAEISHRGNLPNAGMQERAIFDGRWKLIYREKTEPPWRQVQADSKEWPKWGNRTYAETVRVKEQFPEAFRVLAGLDPQNLGGKVPALELYDLQTDPEELHNLAVQPAHQVERDRLYAALRQWVQTTADPAVQPPSTSPEPEP